MVVYWIFWSILVAGYLSPCSVSAQAPGDEDDFCLEISTAPAYASSVKPLLDSWRYQTLLGSDGVWDTLSLDNDDIGWVPNPSSICQESVTVTEPLSIPQQNWLFTQHISKSMDPSDSYPVKIFVNVSYTFDTDCDVECTSFVQLLYYLSNNNDSQASEDHPLYTKLSNLTASNDKETFPMIQFSTSNFSIQPEDSGFYLAILDSGANVTVYRILVYHFIGPMKQIGLTLLPETPAPIAEFMDVDGVCVANSNTTSGGPPSLTLSPNGDWTNVEQCVCIEGHYKKEVESLPACVACSPGEYKDVQGNDNCLPCPTNSQSEENGAAACTCLPSFYRSQDEGPEVKCTGPPSFPQQILISNVQHTSADISWSPPSDLGGRSDLYYNISYSQSSTWTYPEPDPIHNTHYKLEGLTPCSLYFVLVIAENGVSSQAGGQSQRSVGGFLLTTEGTPKVTNVEVLEGVIIDWTPLTDFCVVISEYHVQFRVDDQAGGASFITVPSNKAVYEVNVTADLPSTGQPVYVVVRANSSETGVGEWSDPVLFAEVNPNAPPEQPTSSSTSSKVTSATNTNSLPSSPSTSSTSTATPTSKSGTTIPTTSPTSSTSDENTLTILLLALFLAIAVVIIAIIAIAIVCYVYCRKRRSKEEVDYARMQASTGRVEFKTYVSETVPEEPDGTEDTKELIENK